MVDMIAKNTTDLNRITVRPAEEADRQKLATLIHFSPYVHRHLGWRSPLDWLGIEPYLVAERDEQILAALACPPDIPDIAWVSLFAVSTAIQVDDAWEMMWPVADRLLGEDTPIAALPLQSWFQRLLENSNFTHSYDVLMMRWEDRGQQIKSLTTDLSYRIRMMNFDDLNVIHDLDKSAFDPFWRHSLELLELAFQYATFATVAEDKLGIMGYQLSTANNSDGHLARLAVHPRARRLGVAHTLVGDLLKNYRRRGICKVTVNTQENNLASLSLYKKIGFAATGEIYPVFET